MPWLIDKKNNQNTALNEALKLWPNNSGSNLRFMAFGFDAYQLIPHLERLYSSDFEQLKGKTGILSINQQRIVKRRLSCGRFKQGTIRLIGLAPSPVRAMNLMPTDGATQLISSN